MTVAERKRVYRTKLHMNRAKRVGRLLGFRYAWAEWQYWRNSHVCRSLEERRRDYERLTHAYLLEKDIDLDV